ncbi:SusC/RagA family TonB-linked outer membrane protein [Taibaiella soli]|uniref:SusC/RagA family TonB-linked outer membrane protein n=1 Tax=Taibaiella soli TaxID=1649169 RepID=A0A2W2B9U5_9BACT|nr:SusC/RagA family TonB-linked outer membrane protein [Taibaiella soli]PZF73009.1 SusC/RagA family TonB-linked outer membrane protein [Taibaiella soli]
MKRILLLLIVLLTVSAEAVMAQARKVSGRVLDERNQGLPGAGVAIKGTTLGTVTDVDGNFSVDVPAENKVLTIQSVGYATQDVNITGGTIVVRMQPASNELKEAVVTGALNIRREKRDIGYSATTLSSQDLTAGNNVSALSAIQGKTAGVNITSATGGPGGSTRVVLRGEKSLGNGNNALIVVDGIPINNSSRLEGVSDLSQIDFGNQGNDINPDDIESITVLKGPAAAALYGSIAANGAIMITTKSGRTKKQKSKTEVSFQTRYTLSNILKYPDFQNSYGQGNVYDGIADDHRENFSWGEKFDGQLRPWGQVIDGQQLVKPYSAQPNNIKDFFNTGKTLENNLSLGGGDEKNAFYLSLNTLNNTGVTPNTFYDKYSVRFNGTHDFSNKVYASLNFNYLNISQRVETQGQSANGQGAVWDNLLQTPRDIPVQELKNLDNPFYGYGFTDPNGIQRYGYYGAYSLNPYFVADKFDNRDKTDRIISAVTVGYKPTSHWNIYDRAGVDVISDRTFQKIPKYFYQPFDEVYYSNPDGTTQNQTNNGGYFQGSDARLSFYNDAIANYNNQLSQDIGIDLTVGNNIRYSAENILTSNIDPNTNGLVIPDYYNFGNAQSNVASVNSYFRSGLVAAYGDLRLDYKKTVFLEMTGRNDWSSTLAPGHWSFFYPSMTASWVFTETFKGNFTDKVLTYGKLRGGYASVGNGAGIYQNNAAGFARATSSTQFGSVTFPFATPAGGLIPGYTLGNVIGNPDLRPERTNSWEVGTDLQFFQNRASVEFTYYDNMTVDQITTIPVAPSSGYTGKVVNVGNVRNNGVELAIRVTPISTRSGFRWELFGTYYKNNSMVERLNEGTSQISLGGASDMQVTATVGKPYGAFYGTDLQTDAQGRTVVDSASGMPKLSSTAVYKGSFQPKFIASWGTTLSYKGLTFNVLFNTKQGGVFYSATKDLMDFTGTSEETGKRDPYVFPNSVYINSQGQSVTNTTNFSPYSYYTRVEPAGQNIVNASYVKLQEASLYYTLPAKWFNRAFLGSVMVGAYGNNLFIWTAGSNKYVDPEVNAAGATDVQGFDFRARPSLRNYGFTVKVTF